MSNLQENITAPSPQQTWLPSAPIISPQRQKYVLCGSVQFYLQIHRDTFQPQWGKAVAGDEICSCSPTMHSREVPSLSCGLLCSMPWAKPKSHKSFKATRCRSIIELCVTCVHGTGREPSTFNLCHKTALVPSPRRACWARASFSVLPSSSNANRTLALSTLGKNLSSRTPLVLCSWQGHQGPESQF